MKTMKSALLSIAIMLSSSTLAQGYHRLQLNFAPQTMEVKDAKMPNDYDWGRGWDGAKFNTIGFGIGFVKGIELSKTTPLFLETGANLTYLTKESKEDINFDYLISSSIDFMPNNDKIECTSKYKFLNLAIPINLAYRINVADAFSVQPYAGLNLKFNIVGIEKVDWGSSVSYDIGFFTKEKHGDVENDYFFEEKANRFQLGLNIGCGFNIAKKLYVSYAFQPDLTKYSECYNWNGDKTKVKTRSNIISIGFNF